MTVSPTANPRRLMLRCHLAVIRNAADNLVSTGMRELGYEYVMLDAGWGACLKQHWCTHRTPAGYCGVCETPAPRLAGGVVLVDPAKFPPSAPGVPFLSKAGFLALKAVPFLSKAKTTGSRSSPTTCTRR